MLYIFCDSDNGAVTPGTLYQTTSTWPANSDRWLSIATAIANTTIQSLADDLTFLVQGANDFASVNLAALTAALSVTVEGDATGAVWDDTKATIVSSASGNGSITLSLAVAQTLKDLQLLTVQSSGTPRTVYMTGAANIVLTNLKAKSLATAPTAGAMLTGAANPISITATNCVVDSSGATTPSSGISLQSSIVGNFYNCFFHGGATGATNPDNVVNCAFFGYTTQGGSSGNYKYCATVNNTGTNPITVSDWNAVFQDYANFDYRLKAGAALIGAGIGPASDANVPVTDIAGNPRSGTTTDAGAAMYAASYSVTLAWLAA